MDGVTSKLAELEREAIFAELARQGGSRTETAKALGVPLRTLRYKLGRYKKQGFAVIDNELVQKRKRLCTKAL